MRHYLLPALVNLLAPLALQGQSEPVAVRPEHVPPPVDSTADSSRTPPPPSCWRARPRPPCEGFFLTDFGLEVPVASTRRTDAPGVRGGQGPDFGIRGVWTFGFMGTAGRHSHGATLSFLLDEMIGESLSYTLEWRYRNWLSRSAAVDAAIGYKRAPMWQNGAGLVPARGMTMLVALTPNRWIGVSARMDLMRVDGRTPRALLLGVQSTRVSEGAIKFVAVEMLRAALARIGVELEDGDEEDR